MAVKTQTDDTSSIRAVILRLLDTTQLSQREFSRRWGVSESMTAKIVKGTQRDISLEFARKLVHSFALNAWVLFPDEQEDSVYAQMKRRAARRSGLPLGSGRAQGARAERIRS